MSRVLKLQYSLKGIYYFRIGLLTSPVNLLKQKKKTDYRNFNNIDSACRFYCSQPWLKLLPSAMKDVRFLEKASQVPDKHLTPITETNTYSIAILEGLHASESIDDILRAFHELGLDMNEIHVARGVSRIATIVKQENRQSLPSTGVALVLPQKNLIVKKKANFLLVCQLVLQHSIHMENDLFLETLDSLHFLGVPVKSTVMQTLLTQASERLNDFNPNEMTHFVQCLTKMSKDHHDNLVNALLESCCILMDKFAEKTEISGQITSIIVNLQNRLSNEKKQMLLNKLHAILIVKNIDLKSSFYILNALSYLKIRKHPIQYKVLDFLKENFKSIDGDSTVNLIHRLNACGCINPKSLEVLAEKVLENSEKLSLQHFIRITEIMASNRHLNKKFLQYVANYALTEKTDFKNILKLGEMFAALNVHSVFRTTEFCAELYESALSVTNTEMLDLDTCKSILSTSAALLQLGYVPDKLLSFIEDSKCKELLFNNERTHFDFRVSQNFLIISLLTGSSYNNEKFSPPTYKKHKSHSELSSVVKSVLEEIVPEVNVTLDVPFIDGVPLNIDFLIEANSSIKRTCILLAPSTFFAAGSSHLLGMPAAEHTFLTNRGYNVFWIPVHKLERIKSVAEKKNNVKEILRNMF